MLHSALLLVLSLASIRTEFTFPSPREKRAAWSARTMVQNLQDATPDGLDLQFVNVIWRHGDRSPTSPMAGERAPEELWTFGGGGYGELSPIGMSQHYNLGKKLFDRYAANNVFLSETYKSREVYVHCTDKNRTIVSAMSNFAGMYSGRPKGKVGRDYPDVSGWPSMFVPIPVHTEFGVMDHIGDPATKCQRQTDLWNLVQQTKDYKDANNDETEKVLQYLRDATGAEDSQITFENVYKIWDNMLIENIWFPENVSEWYPYYTKEINDKVTAINNAGIEMVNGIMKDKMVNGLDLTIEIPTIRGGPLINEIMTKARGVLQCRLRDFYGQDTTCANSKKFYRNLKYHVISSHDTTIAAYLTVLGAKTHVLENGGYPVYSAAINTEFFIDRRNGGTEMVFRVLYHDSEDTDFRVITPFVEGCTEDFCSIEKLQILADRYAPPGGIEKLCQQRVAL